MLAFWNECAGRGGRLANGRLAAAGAEALMNTRASDRIAEEQAALRRVAMLAALGAPAEEVFTAVTTEVWRLLDVDLTAMARYDPDDVMTYVARWGTTSDARGGGMHTTLGGRNIGTLVFETGRLARMDDFSTASGPAADLVRMLGIRSSVGAPILVEGRLWGVMIVASRSGRPLPADTEARLTGFTELVGTAIANAQARTELRRYADEQAALRRVATLVAGGVPPGEGVRGGRRGSRAAAGRRPDSRRPVRTGRGADRARRVEQAPAPPCLSTWATGSGSAARTWPRISSGPTSRHGSTTTAWPRARSPPWDATGGSAPRWVRRSG